MATGGHYITMLLAIASHDVFPSSFCGERCYGIHLFKATEVGLGYTYWFKFCSSWYQFIWLRDSTEEKSTTVLQFCGALIGFQNSTTPYTSCSICGVLPNNAHYMWQPREWTSNCLFHLLQDHYFIYYKTNPYQIRQDDKYPVQVCPSKV